MTAKIESMTAESNRSFFDCVRARLWILEKLKKCTVVPRCHENGYHGDNVQNFTISHWRTSRVKRVRDCWDSGHNHKLRRSFAVWNIGNEKMLALWAPNLRTLDSKRSRNTPLQQCTLFKRNPKKFRDSRRNMNPQTHNRPRKSLTGGLHQRTC